MMRVGLVISEMEIGGAETLVVALAGRLRQRGHVPVIVSLATGGALVDAARHAGADVVSLGLGRLDPRAVWILADVLRRHRVDIVHLHLPRAGVLGRIASRRLGLHPVVYTEHNVWGAYGTIMRRMNQWTMPWADHLIAVSEEVRRCVIVHGVPADRVTTIRNGIDVDALRRAAARGPSLRGILGLPPDAVIVGVVANLHPRKGLDVLVAALPHLQRHWPEAHVVIIGRDDGMGTHLRQIAVDAGVGAHVHLLGPRRDVAALLPEFNVFVLPSRVEGLPIALLEAMALERPVVVTPVGGVPEVVEHGRDGLHVPVGNPQAIAGAVERLLEAPAEAEALGRAAAARVQRDFSLDRMVEGHIHVYAAALERAHGARQEVAL